MEVLSYNQTTRDWRVHNGVDFAAAAGTAVTAAADGEVYTVYEDDQMGMTVVIRHEGGYTTRYSSLGADVAVSAGQQVLMGQTIGTVGTSALMENALGDHVHFTVTKDDEPVDPMEFLQQ
jgi:murein DD-endopeptidase MepM/ murein hydrolase activator NlpD